VRIVTGVLKGRSIPYNPRLQGRIRLTSSKLKEAIFAMLGADLSGRSFLDLCAGCGQLGLEAHSRGARVTINEPDKRRCTHIRTLLQEWNLQGIDLYSNKAQVLIPRLQTQQRPFHTIYLDPPYHEHSHGRPLSLKLLELLGHDPVLEQDGLIFVQCQSDLDLPQTEGRLSLLRQRDYGKTILGIYHPA